MNCAACGREAREDDRFCSGCGAPLSGSAGTDVVDDLIRDYQRELADRPDDAGLLYNLGLALERKGRFEDALAAWRRIRDTDPGFGDVANAVARVEGRLKASDPT